MTPWLVNLLGHWGAPGDAVAWAALATGLGALVLARAKAERLLFLPNVSERAWLTACAFVAAFLSLGYVAFYLRGGPRIIDATAYLHQARALASGHFGSHIPVPSESFRGRFLLYDDTEGTLAGLFPPGYPVVLSLGVRLGAPMVVGPVLAFALVFATARLAREMCERTSLDAAAKSQVVRVAALAQVLCAAMRYHTADTMSHGLAALLVATALSFALTAARCQESPGASGFLAHALVSGLCIGMLGATRLASAPPIALVTIVLLLRAKRHASLFDFALGLLPGLTLLLASQDAVAGSPWASAQQLYYARSDGPATCFRYGFGADVGCMFEHGDFVRARLEGGYGLVSALGVTLRRLRSHLTDVQNVEPLALVLLVWTPRTRAASRLGVAIFFLFVLAYAPFYFDGNYPGGGARFYADVLPLSHVLFALGAHALMERLKRVSYTRVATVLLGVGLAGFAVHASHDHRLLADREGGRPMFERDALVAAGVTHGLVLVDTDHGFLLGHDPAVDADAHGAKTGVVVARLRGDASDRLLYDALGSPPTFRYERGESGAAPRLTPFNVPPPRADGAAGYRFESENEWPALSQALRPVEDAYALPAWASGGCASNGRVLRITAGEVGVSGVKIALPVPVSGPLWLSVRIRGSGTGARMTVQVPTEQGPVSLSAPDPPEGTCVDLPPAQVVLRPWPRTTHGREAHVEVTVTRPPPQDAPHDRARSAPHLTMDLDALTLRP